MTRSNAELNVLPDFRQVRAPVDPATLTYKHLLDGDFWKKIPAYADIDRETFLDHRWQSKKTITKPAKLLQALEGLVSPAFLADAERGFQIAPMAVRVSPYLLSLIDWDNPEDDPLRIQFLPLASRFLPDHPKLGLDSLHEQADSPLSGLTHRYPDKTLFLVIDTCPVYCRFCTRSYAIGMDTNEVEKISLKANAKRWEQTYAYLATRPEVEDVVISGGDAYNMRADWIRTIATNLLELPNIRRIRFASKGLAVMPQKVLSDDDWFRAIAEMSDLGRSLEKQVAFHTHFNSPNEITEISRQALSRFYSAGVVVRNQSVLLRGVNDTVPTMGMLVKRLSHINVQPYYVYVHDLVQGGEDMRTTVQTAIDLEKHIRGMTAGFNTPTFVVDAPGGGGKRNAHSFEVYHRNSGISIYTAPSVKPGKYFYYFDPIDSLTPEFQAMWQDPTMQQKMLDAAMADAKGVPRSIG